jgi:hypothetical protein
MALVSRSPSSPRPASPDAVIAGHRPRARRSCMRPAGYACKPELPTEPDLRNPSRRAVPAVRFAALFDFSKQPLSRSPHLPGTSQALSPQLLHRPSLTRRFTTWCGTSLSPDRSDGRSPSWPSGPLRYADCSAGSLYSKGHRLRSSPLRSDALHSAAHTCIPECVYA